MSTLKTQEFWTENHISIFWDWVSSSKYWQNKYFTNQLGRGIKRFIKSKIDLEGEYLDYGCGSGHLLELMISTDKLNCYGLEYSPQSQEIVSAKMKGKPNWKGCSILSKTPSDFKSNQFDVITFIETIEHLKDEMLAETLLELHRILKPNGKLIITTPNNEHLPDNHVYCPFCDSEFHRMQHMRSFDSEALERTLHNFKFKSVFCQSINFSKWDSFKNSSRYWIQFVLQLLRLKKYKDHNKPHLVGIFTK